MGMFVRHIPADEIPKRVNYCVTIEIAPWVWPWMACTAYFVKKYGWPFNKKADIETVIKKICAEGVGFEVGPATPCPENIN